MILDNFKIGCLLLVVDPFLWKNASFGVDSGPYELSNVLFFGENTGLRANSWFGLFLIEDNALLSVILIVGGSSCLA
jgi:hypothetical protein